MGENEKINQIEISGGPPITELQQDGLHQIDILFKPSYLVLYLNISMKSTWISKLKTFTRGFPKNLISGGNKNIFIRLY